VTVKAKGGQIRLQPIQASLYDGHFDGDIGLNVITDTPRTSINEKLSTVNIGPLLKDVMGDELVSGKANISAQLNATGMDIDTIKRTLNGKANFNFRDGKVKGVNIGQMLREANAKIKNKPAPPKTENVTDFAEMSGSVTIQNGIVRNDDLDAKSPLLRIQGKGKADLPNERINYRVNTAIVESNEGQTGKELEDLKSLIIPIKVSGNLTDPRFSLDLKPVLEARAKKAVEAEKKKIKKRAEKKLEQKKKDVVEDLKKKLQLKF
jgi:AsmA protein